MTTTALRAATTGLLAAPEPTLTAHLAVHGPLPPAAGLLEELQRAGLTGRGGGAYPTWRKLDATRRAAERGLLRRGGVVVANGAEGEPASAKDATLLTRAPHLVLDGLELTAAATGARRAIVYVAQTSAGAVSRALSERPADALPIEIVTAADGFVAGETSAVVAALEGRAAVPADKTVRVSERGVGARPTAIHNVETLAHIAMIARYGATWFRRRGTPDEPGTMLTTFRGRVAEVPLGVPLRTLVDPAAGPVLVGGFHGAWLRPAEIAHLSLSAASLAPFGAGPGAGVLLSPGPRRCGLVETARITRFLADASARQCGPCRDGLPALADALDTLVAGRSDGEHEAIVLTRLVDGRGACHHPDGTARLARSALRVFADDVHAHRRGRCLATPFGGSR